MFYGYSKIVSRVIEEGFKGLSSKFQGGFNRVSRMFLGYVLEV